MDIGNPKRTIIVEPAKSPLIPKEVPQKEPERAPEKAPEPVPDREKVPA